jgi:hypothetical protein
MYSLIYNIALKKTKQLKSQLEKCEIKYANQKKNECNIVKTLCGSHKSHNLKCKSANKFLVGGKPFGLISLINLLLVSLINCSTTFFSPTSGGAH